MKTPAALLPWYLTSMTALPRHGPRCFEMGIGKQRYFPFSKKIHFQTSLLHATGPEACSPRVASPPLPPALHALHSSAQSRSLGNLLFSSVWCQSGCAVLPPSAMALSGERGTCCICCCTPEGCYCSPPLDVQTLHVFDSQVAFSLSSACWKSCAISTFCVAFYRAKIWSWCLTLTSYYTSTFFPFRFLLFFS